MCVWAGSQATAHWLPILARTTSWFEIMSLCLFMSLCSLAPGKFEWIFRHVIFKQILVIDGWGISCEIALIWMSLGFTDDQSTLVQVMAWCHQATSHYLSQCWPRSLSPYGITRPQWDLNNMISMYITRARVLVSGSNSLAPGRCGNNFKI